MAVNAANFQTEQKVLNIDQKDIRRKTSHIITTAERVETRDLLL